jgi:hypothetical protein
MSSPTQRWSVALAIAGIPTLALTIGALSANHPLGVLLTMAEPLLFAAVMVLLVSCLIRLQHGLAASILASAVIGTLTLHLPTEKQVNSKDGPQWLRALRGCAVLSKPARAPIRLLIWTIDEQQGLDESIDLLLDLRPDIIVLNGTDDPTLGSHLSTVLDGEVKFFPSAAKIGGMTTVVRGSFQYCGGNDDHWTVPLPSKETGGGQTIITFPHIEDVGVFPLLITRLDPTSGVSDWLNWGQRVIDGAQKTADTAATIGTRKMVVMGDMQIPARSAPLSTSLGDVGLRSVHSEPNWPTHVMNVPVLTQHARDQAWVGSGWHVQAARVLPGGNQQRLPVMFDLVPDTSKAP